MATKVFGGRLIKMSMLYLMIGIGFSIWMFANQKTGFRPVMYNILIFGWATSAICGILYQQFSKLGRNWMATLHFWLYSLGTLTLVAGLFFLVQGYGGAETTITTAFITILASKTVFTMNLIKNI